MTSTEDRNREFYDRLYGRRGAVGHLVRAFISFDQRSKAVPNARTLAAVIPRHRMERSAGSPHSPITPVLRLLDYGCGWGTLLLTLRRRGLDLYGYDLSPTAVQGVARAAALLGEVVSEAPRDPNGRLATDFFDVVVCSHVIEHVADDRKLLQEFRATLRSGGHLLLNVPINEVVDDAKHARSYTKADIRARVEEAGFRVVDARAVDHWTAFLLDSVAAGGLLRRAAVRTLRGALAVIPWRVGDAIGRCLLARTYRRQQFLLLCKTEL